MSIDSDEPCRRNLVSPSSSSDGDRKRIVAANSNEQSRSGNGFGNGANRAGFVAVRINHVTEVVAHHSCPSANRIARLKRFGITRKNLTNRCGREVCRTWGD
jgi:hypothetical protein